jgi:hypothetical protein
MAVDNPVDKECVPDEQGGITYKFTNGTSKIRSPKKKNS